LNDRVLKLSKSAWLLRLCPFVSIGTQSAGEEGDSNPSEILKTDRTDLFTWFIAAFVKAVVAVSFAEAVDHALAVSNPPFTSFACGL